MKPILADDWNALETQLRSEFADDFNTGVLGELQGYLGKPGSLFPTVQNVAIRQQLPPVQVEYALDWLASHGYLKRTEQRPCPQCTVNITDDDIQRLRCSYCQKELDENALPESIIVYEREAKQSEDVRWVLTIHGMNTPGDWQQDFSWQLAKLYNYAVPVGIYKYGNIKFSPLIPYRQKVHRERLLRHLRKLRIEMRKKYGERPDVIAHSFGTWLLAQAIIADKSAEPIRLGRVILTGSIVPPDFDWNRLLDEDRVEAVMCHYGGRDVPVRVAQYLIPGSGPSGRYGFNDQTRVVHKFEKHFGHSDYFRGDCLGRLINQTWKDFLTTAEGDPFVWRDPPKKLSWKPSRWQRLTRITKALLLILLTLTLILFALAIPFGVAPVVRWLAELTHEWLPPLVKLLE